MADLPAIMTMFDEAIAWMVSRGNTRQWGTEPWSTQPEKVASIRKRVEEADLWLAEVGGVPVGTLITDDKPNVYVNPVDEPELFVTLLLVSRGHAGREIGARLLAHARTLAAAKGVVLIRVDCYRGEDEQLIRYYERNGFVRTHQILVGEWPGQVLEQRLPATSR